MTANGGFTDSQKSYLQGFAMGADVARHVRGLPILSGSGGVVTTTATTVQVGPGGAEVLKLPATDDLQLVAQNRFLASGKTLSREEQAKRDKSPFSMWTQMKQAARDGVFPKGTDVFLWKYHGLFYVNPAQDSYMCRLRLPGGELRSWQLRGLADLAQRHGGGFLDITTRANLQIREIPAESGCAVHEGLADLGIINKGSGADNVRNVTCSATSGFDSRELIETLPIAKEMHHLIINHRELYGLPRKFNISFEGGGAIATLEDTNDIGFQAVRVTPLTATADLPAGVYFRLTLGGITGHRDFARPTGVILKPDECLDVAYAILRIFLDHGDRTDRNKARLKYLLDNWGFEKFIAEIEDRLDRKLLRATADQYELPPPPDRWAHIGVHAQRQPDRFYVGVVLPVGRLSCEQARRLAGVAERYGSGQLRLTVWQNLIIPDIGREDVEAVQQELEEMGLSCRASSARAGLVACTGNSGCKYAGANTKAHALELANHLDERCRLDVPINLHFTGCHHSCAQHYIGDLGFRGTNVEVNDDMVEGYEVVIGGGYADQQQIARQLFAGVAFAEIPLIVERLIAIYLAERRDQESFAAFANRQDLERLRQIALGKINAALLSSAQSHMSLLSTPKNAMSEAE